MAKRIDWKRSFGNIKVERDQLKEEIATLRDVGISCELFCPECGHQHVDRAEPENDWTNPVHRTHKCRACGHLWRPYPVATFGVISKAAKVDLFSLQNAISFLLSVIASGEQLSEDEQQQMRALARGSK